MRPRRCRRLLLLLLLLLLLWQRHHMAAWEGAGRWGSGGVETR